MGYPNVSYFPVFESGSGMGEVFEKKQENAKN